MRSTLRNCLSSIKLLHIRHFDEVGKSLNLALGKDFSATLEMTIFGMKGSAWQVLKNK